MSEETTPKKYTIKCRIKSVNVNLEDGNLYLTLAGTDYYFLEEDKINYNFWYEKNDNNNPIFEYKERDKKGHKASVEYVANIQHTVNVEDKNKNKFDINLINYNTTQLFLSLLTSGTICSITATKVDTPPKGDPPQVPITITSIKVEA